LNSALQPLVDIVANSKGCTRHSFKQRGVPRLGYIQGIALVFARDVCAASDRDDVQYVERAVTTNMRQDALAWYDSQYRDIGMDNTTPGNDVTRSVFTLLIGLGMRESSGQFCCGRDMSASFTSADSAEAGLYQASYGSVATEDAVLSALYDRYANDHGEDKCFNSVFSLGGGDRCREDDYKNWGASTSMGYKWQALTKTCPAFATDWSAVLLRSHGGRLGEFGTTRRHEAEVIKPCSDMLEQVQIYVKDHRDEVCGAF